MKTSKRTIPLWGVLSVALTPFAGLYAVLAAVIIEGIWGSPFTSSYVVERKTALDTAILGAIRAVVLLTGAFVAVGVVSAVIALASRERPRWLPVLGLVATAFLIGLFHYFAGVD